MRKRNLSIRKNFILILAIVLGMMDMPVTALAAQNTTTATDGIEALANPNDTTGFVFGEGDYYETKLSSKALVKSVYQNQSNVALAKITFTKPVTCKEIQVSNGSGSDICPLCEGAEDITYSYDSETQTVSATVGPNAKAGTHSAVVYAGGENENSYRTYATVKFTVLRRIDSITIKADDFLCINTKKGSTWTPKITLNSDAKKKKVTYELLDYEEKSYTESSVLKGFVTLNQKNGSVKLSKLFAPNEDTSKNGFKLRVHAADYTGNDTVVTSDWIKITGTVSPVNGIIAVSYEQMNQYEAGMITKFDPYESLLKSNTTSPYDGQELANRYFLAVNEAGIPMKNVKWSVKGPVKMNTALDNTAVSLTTKGSGLVKLTATTRDGESTTMKFQIALDKDPSLQVTWNVYGVDSSERRWIVGTKGRCYNHPEDQPGNTSIKCDIPYGDVVNVYVGAQNETKDVKAETENAFKIKLEIEGANIIKKHSYRDWDIVPTAKYTYIRMTNLSKKNKPVTLMILHNLCFDEGRKKREVACSTKTLYAGEWYRDDGTKGQDITVSCAQKYDYAIVTLDHGKKTVNSDCGLVGTYPIKNGKFTMSCTEVKKGTIPLLVTFGEKESTSDGKGNKVNAFAQSSQATPITVKVKNPSKPKIVVSDRLTPDGPHACDIDMENNTKRTNIRTISFDQLRNVNQNGIYNNFTDIFYLEDGCIRLKDINGHPIPKSGIYGWVHYTYKTRTDDLTHYGWKKILVKP